MHRRVQAQRSSVVIYQTIHEITRNHAKNEFLGVAVIGGSLSFCSRQLEGFDRDQKMLLATNSRQSDQSVVDVIWLTRRNKIS
jgi:hypothetical protein